MSMRQAMPVRHRISSHGWATVSGCHARHRGSKHPAPRVVVQRSTRRWLSTSTFRQPPLHPCTVLPLPAAYGSIQGLRTIRSGPPPESLPALLRSALCLVFLELSLAVRSARLSHHGELASASAGRCQKSQSSSLLGAVPSGGGAAVIGTTSGKLASASSDSCQSSSDAGAARSVSAPMG
jgi:hypothetical protein